jgi:hypothetical protein
MHTILEWFNGQTHILAILQIALDLALILLVLLLLTRKRGNTATAGHQELTDSLERIIGETKQIAIEFDSNLQERKLLIQQILSRLDVHLEEARQVARQLESQHSVSRNRLTKEPPARDTGHHEILLLAKEGHDARSIATQLKKPIGEVELILKLQRLSDK